MSEFVHKGIIAVGWPKTGDLTGLDKNAIERRLTTAFPGRDKRWLSRSVGTLWRFCEEMKLGDLVIVAPKKAESLNVSVARLAGPYRFDPTTDGAYFGYPHHRPVSWLRHDVPRAELPNEIVSTLHSQATLCKTKLDALLAWGNRAGVVG